MTRDEVTRLYRASGNLIAGMALEAAFQMRNRCANCHQGRSLIVRLTEADTSAQSYLYFAPTLLQPRGSPYKLRLNLADDERRLAACGLTQAVHPAHHDLE